MPDPHDLYLVVRPDHPDAFLITTQTGDHVLTWLDFAPPGAVAIRLGRADPAIADALPFVKVERPEPATLDLLTGMGRTVRAIR